MREEARKLEEFRVNQKESRKKVGAAGVQNGAPCLGNQVWCCLFRRSKRWTRSTNWSPPSSRKQWRYVKEALMFKAKLPGWPPIIANMACRSCCSALLGPAWPCWCGRPCENCFSLWRKEEEGFLCQPGKWTSATPRNPTPKEEVPKPGRHRKTRVARPQAKKTYEHKCRDKEEADQNVNRNTNTGNTKQIEKVESDAEGQRDELCASLPAAPSCLSPCSSTPRPCRRSRMLTKQVLHLPQFQQPSAQWKCEQLQKLEKGCVSGGDTKTILMWALPTFCASLADVFYQQSVNTLAKAREDWIKGHVHTCEVKIVE